MGEVQQPAGELVVDDAFRVAEGVGDWQAHIGLAELGLHGAVGEFDHGMDDTLRVDDYLDLVEGHSKQPACLDDFQALVHQGGGIDGHLGPHVPIGMLQSGLPAHAGQFGQGSIQERASRGGEEES